MRLGISEDGELESKVAADHVARRIAAGSGADRPLDAAEHRVRRSPLAKPKVVRDTPDRLGDGRVVGDPVEEEQLGDSEPKEGRKISLRLGVGERGEHSAECPAPADLRAHEPAGEARVPLVEPSPGGEPIHLPKGCGGATSQAEEGGRAGHRADPTRPVPPSLRDKPLAFHTPRRVLWRDLAHGDHRTGAGRPGTIVVVGCLIAMFIHRAGTDVRHLDLQRCALRVA